MKFNLGEPPYATRLVSVEPTLTIRERFRLVEIAHETTDPTIRKAALELLYTPRYLMAEE